MPTASATSPMIPPRASTSRTRCPLATPPTAGLQLICAIRSMFMVMRAVLRPMRAAAMAASHPACPAPTTTTSYCSVNAILNGKTPCTSILPVFPFKQTLMLSSLYLLMSGSFGETVAVGESRHRLPRGRTAPVHPAVSTTGAQHRDRCPSHVRPNSRMSSIAHTRQVTVTRTICGVDISSQSLDARIGHEGAFAQFPNTTEGIAALLSFCQAHQVGLIAMEATGGYEQQAFAQLSEQGLPVAILNPRAVRQFAQSMGSLEKTDRIDAGMIAWYAEVKKSPPLCLAAKSQQHLRALVTRLRQLTDIRTAQLNQQRLVTDRAVQSSFKKLLAMLARQIRDLEQRIAVLLDQQHGDTLFEIAD